jgi:hypothetical protein
MQHQRRAPMTTQAVERRITAAYADHTSQGTMSVLEFDRKARTSRGIKAALKMLAATALFVFIPGAHFVLVPLGILLTPIVGILVSRVHSKIVGASIACPQCGSPLQVLSSKATMPLIENCASCSRPIRISLAV